jgi:hypothetical protein
MWAKNNKPRQTVGTKAKHRTTTESAILVDESPRLSALIRLTTAIQERQKVSTHIPDTMRSE